MISLILSILSILSLFFSTLLALNQITFRRFVISSSMVNSSLILYSLIPSSFESITAFFLFLFFDNLIFVSFSLLVYIIMASTSLYKNGSFTIYDISLIDSFYLKVFIAFTVLSLSGLPPFSLFFFKYLILNSFFFLDSFYHIFFISVCL